MGKPRDEAKEVNGSQMIKELLSHSKKFGLQLSINGKSLNALTKRKNLKLMAYHLWIPCGEWIGGERSKARAWEIGWEISE